MARGGTCISLRGSRHCHVTHVTYGPKLQLLSVAWHSRGTMMQKLFACLILLFSCSAMMGAQDRTQRADLVVYGATASGVMTAYTAARQGLNVVLLEPGSHVGGM